jgi:hypothetical protein
MHWFTSYLVKPAPKAGTADLQAAVDAYNRDHGRDWGRTGGTCPICGHHGCFGPAGGKLRNSGRWACFSANHGDVGVKLPNCHHGDALDVDAHAAGRNCADHLRAKGYLRAPESPQDRKPAPEPTGHTIAPVPPLSEYEIEWLEEMAGRLEFDDTLDYTRESAYAEAQRRLRQIQEGERGARHA